MGAPILWSGEEAKLLKKILNLNDQAKITSGDADPASVATLGVAGDLYISSNGGLYIKQDSGTTTNWIDLTTGGSSVLTTLGDTLYGGVAGVETRLAGNITTTQKFLSQTGDGVDSAAPSWQTVPASGQYIYYFQDTASSVAGYKQQIQTPYTPKTTLTTAGVTNNQLLKTWITNATYPNLTFIPAGQYDVHVHASQTAGTKNSQIYAEIWETDAAGVDIAKIGTTSTSGNLISTETDFIVEFTTAVPYLLTSTASRIATKIYAAVNGGGSAPTINLYYGEIADAKTSFPSQIVSANNFVPYTGATGNVNLGSNTITAPSFIGNADTVTTNANLTGDVTSVGNATSIVPNPLMAQVFS
jgi:hypothetical protein